MREVKKIICIALLILLLTCVALSAVGCNGGTDLQSRDKNLGNYVGKKAENGMSAFDLVMEAYSNFLQEPNFTRDEYFSFSSSVATRNTHLTRKIVDGKVYSQEVIYGTGFDKGTCAKRFYYDGATAMYLHNSKKSDIRYNSSSNTYTVKYWGDFIPFKGDLQKELYELRDKITTYDIYSRDILSPKHDDGVYLTDGVYYCTIKIDCRAEKMKTVQRAALDEFLDMLSAKEKGFEIDDTTLDFAIQKIDGKYKFVIWRRHEKYSGKHSSGIRVSCEQTCISYYTYGDAVITSDDLLNLA
ncbi:MAG: hypothetical protein K2M75_03680 [Clostridia bacterium]|nr:hypothetical protein [Clostridia bacterium]